MTNLEGKSIEELIEMQKPCLYKMAESLCKLISSEIEVEGTKKRVAAWLKNLRDVRSGLLEMEGPTSEMVEIIRSIEKEAEDYLFLPKRIKPE